MTSSPKLPPRRRTQLENEKLHSQSFTTSGSSSGISSDYVRPPPQSIKSRPFKPSLSSSQKIGSEYKTSSNNYNNNTHNSFLNDEWNTISLIIVCALFLILQSYGFRNIALQASGYFSPYSDINHHPTWCPQAKCKNTPRCKPCQRQFLIVIATGRSGSTTLMNLLDLLPNVRMAGENKGQLVHDFESYHNLHTSIELQMKSKEEVEGAWKHFPIPEQSLSCPVQGIYEAINPPSELNENYHGTYDDSQTIIGFKTVRLHQALKNANATEDLMKWEEFFSDTFPCTKFIFNIRGDIEKQVQSWLKAFGTVQDGDIIRDYNRKLSQLAAVLGSDRARVIDMSEWSKKDGSGLVVLNDLVDWLGFSGCRFTSLIHSNKDGYGKDKTKLSLGAHCHLPGNG